MAVSGQPEIGQPLPAIRGGVVRPCGRRNPVLAVVSAADRDHAVSVATACRPPDPSGSGRSFSPPVRGRGRIAEPRRPRDRPRGDLRRRRASSDRQLLRHDASPSAGPAAAPVPRGDVVDLDRIGRADVCARVRVIDGRAADDIDLPTDCSRRRSSASGRQTGDEIGPLPAVAVDGELRDDARVRVHGIVAAGDSLTQSRVARRHIDDWLRRCSRYEDAGDEALLAAS